MTEIVTIQNVRAYLDANNTAWLNAADVARGLGFTEEKNGVEYVMWRRVNEYLQGFGFSALVSKDDFIPENMFYRLAMKAKNETAQIFQAKVADEILPAIRKRGVYATDDFIERTLANPDFAIRVFSELKAERERNAILQPKADYCDAVLDSSELLDITDIAKEYGFSGQTFNRIIADFGIQYRKGNTWALRQEYTGGRLCPIEDKPLKRVHRHVSGVDTARAIFPVSLFERARACARTRTTCKRCLNHGGARVNYKLKAARKRLGLSQAEIARIVGVSTRMYQCYELEESEPRASTAIRIADALNVQDLRELWKKTEVET